MVWGGLCSLPHILSALSAMVMSVGVTADWGVFVAVDVFVSFDYDNDARLKDLLIGQARNLDSPFDVADWSVKIASAGWREDALRRIRRADQVIVLCGTSTHTATGVNAEIAMAREERTPYFLLAGYSTGATKPTSALSSDKLYSWTWPNLKTLINGGR